MGSAQHYCRVLGPQLTGCGTLLYDFDDGGLIMEGHRAALARNLQWSATDLIERATGR